MEPRGPDPGGASVTWKARPHLQAPPWTPALGPQWQPRPAVGTARSLPTSLLPILGWRP